MIVDGDVYLEPGDYTYTLPVDIDERWSHTFLSKIPYVVENIKQEFYEKSDGRATITSYSIRKVRPGKYEVIFNIHVSQPTSPSPQVLPLVAIAVISASIAAIGVPLLVSSGSLDKVIPEKEDFTNILYLGVGALSLFALAYFIRSF